MRAQTSLPALGIALVLLVSTTTVAVTLAEEQRRTSGDKALERASAMAATDALVAADSPVTRRANVVHHASLRGLDAAALEARYGLDNDSGVRVRLGERTIVSRGTVTEGTTIHRLVIVENRSRRTIVPTFRAARNVTLPRRTPNATLTLTPSGNATVETVRVDGRVALEDPGGLVGTYTVPVSRYRTATIEFEGGGTLSQGDVRVTFYPAVTRKATLAVTVQRWGAADG